MTKRPIIGVTMGDPCGNGPEITIKALSDPELYRKCRPIVIGDAACMLNNKRMTRTGRIL